jgi:hypothetical protein
MSNAGRLRYELKYLIDRRQHGRMIEILSGRMHRDRHGDDQGMYPITSLYYDTPGYKAYWDKLDGQRSRRKVRVRVYGSSAVTPDTRAFVEVKQRVNKLMRKRRVPLPYAQAVALDDYPTLAEQVGEPYASTLREVYYLYRTLQLRPACTVAYDRLAFVGDEPYGDLRVTLDTGLHGRTHDLSLLSTGYAADRYAMAPDRAILEVKANHNIPSWLAQILAQEHCTFYRISKYCAVLEANQAVSGRQHVLLAPPTPRPIL